MALTLSTVPERCDSKQAFDPADVALVDLVDTFSSWRAWRADDDTVVFECDVCGIPTYLGFDEVPAYIAAHVAGIAHADLVHVA